jgi:UDP:flavonoid glycosyltransferase YjiC (YdhE family)
MVFPLGQLGPALRFLDKARELAADRQEPDFISFERFEFVHPKHAAWRSQPTLNLRAPVSYGSAERFRDLRRRALAVKTRSQRDSAAIHAELPPIHVIGLMVTRGDRVHSAFGVTARRA